jgi:excisionase family DNA binding protein
MPGRDPGIASACQHGGALFPLPREHPAGHEPGAEPAGPGQGDDGTAAAPASQAGQDQAAGRLVYSVGEAARLTGLSRDLLYDQMRRGNLSYLKVGRRRLITRQHLNQFLGIAS